MGLALGKTHNQIGIILALIGYRRIVENHAARKNTIFRHKFCVAGILGNRIDDTGDTNAGSADSPGDTV